MLTLRLLPPKSYRLRNRPPEWDIEDDAGHVVGHLAEHHIGGSSKAFYNLTGIHPETGEHIPLELSADRDERVRRLEEFLADPDRFAAHYPSMSKAARILEERHGAPLWQIRSSRSAAKD